MATRSILYNSSDGRSILAAARIALRYPYASLYDLSGKTQAQTDTVISGLALLQTAIYSTVESDYVAETLSRCTVTFTGIGTTNDIINVMFTDGVTTFLIGSYKQTGADDSVTKVALALKNNINFNTALNGFTAGSSSGVLTIYAPAGKGATYNGYAVSTVVSTGATFTVSNTNFASGVTAVGSWSAGMLTAAQLTTLATYGTVVNCYNTSGTGYAPLQTNVIITGKNPSYVERLLGDITMPNAEDTILASIFDGVVILILNDPKNPKWNELLNVDRNYTRQVPIVRDNIVRLATGRAIYDYFLAHV